MHVLSRACYSRLETYSLDLVRAKPLSPITCHGVLGDTTLGILSTIDTKEASEGLGQCTT